VTEDGCAFLVMDLLEGENLEARRERKGGKLKALEVLSLMDEVLDTLKAAHAKGVVHRDIKPENLFLTTDNTVRLLDFGIAHINRPEDPGKTLAGVAMGTPAFMPPEQASARWDEVDARSDLWALGASMFTLLTGRYVHEGGTVNESLVLAVTQKAPPIESVEPDLPPPIAELVNRALQRSKDARFAHAEEMQIAVRRAYKELQDGSTSQRYSISDGRLANHSAPPSGMFGDVPGTNVATGDPVSSDVADFKSNPGTRRMMLLGGGLFAGFVALGIGLSKSDDKPKPRVVATPPIASAPAVSVAQTPAAVSEAPMNAGVTPAGSVEVPVGSESDAGAEEDRSSRKAPKAASKDHRPRVPKALADPFSQRE
jgi:serine/threonine-protein kinase